MPKITVKRKKYCLMKIGMLDKLIAKSTNPKQKVIYKEFRNKFVRELPKKYNPDLAKERELKKKIDAENKILADKLFMAEMEDVERIKLERKQEKERLRQEFLEVKATQREKLKRLKVLEELEEETENN